ncbi:hypothetical protein [Neorhodopirellula pilleata]|uniref:hypothetical protein n=1 Tax=Neorhodopirellula pilleata TaxID=2714738 RepID=UPI001E426444|nr:hypothetical protein [Neorhodopirellula pilleata]
MKSRTTMVEIREYPCLTARTLRCLAAMAVWLLVWPATTAEAQLDGHIGTASHRQAILDSLPLDRLTAEARNRILEVAEKPTLFRQLPSQAITCDRDMFLFLTRNPDVLVGLWDMMGITQVQSQRTGPFQIQANDGAGTLCHVDLVYGDDRQHIFVVDGSYDGRMVPKPIRGKGVFVLRSSYATGADGETTISGTLDCFVQLESLGIDLIARTLSPIIGRSADSNFTQTAQFISQVSQSSAHNPSAMLDIASRLPQVEPPIRKTFADTIVTVARRSAANSMNQAAQAKAQPTQVDTAMQR